jgi:hypothetical protein
MRPVGTAPLIAPIVINGTEASSAKHGEEAAERGLVPYANDALAHLAHAALQRIAGDLLCKGALSHDMHAKLMQTSAHASRHTFGTRTVAREKPMMWRTTSSGTHRCRRLSSSACGAQPDAGRRRSVLCRLR